MSTAVPAIFAMVCGGIFVVAFVALGAFLLIYGLRSKRKAGASQGWPSVQGQIVTSEVKQSISHDDDGGQSVSYYPAVQYAYQVNGQGYMGKQISFGGTLGGNDPAKAQAKLAPYPPNAMVTVYYDPAKPQDAVLERSSGGATWAIAVGAVVLALSLCGGGALVLGVINSVR